MTTIAWDGKTLACDSLIGRGDIIYNEQDKLFKLDTGAYMGASGSSADIYKLRDWLNSPESDKPSIEDCAAIVVYPDGSVFEYYDGLTADPAPNIAAQGSGWQIALAVMMHGGTAIEAVEIASKLDKNTGGKICHVSFPLSIIKGPS